MARDNVFKISNDLGAIQEFVDNITSPLEARWSPRDIQAVKMGLYETIVNAIEHGNLAIDSETKNKALEAGNLDHIIEERAKKDPFSSRMVTIECVEEDEKAIFIVSDEGDGFNRHDMPDPTDDENVEIPHGRGIFIVRSLMDEVSFNEKGNSVCLAKYYTGNT